MILGLPQKLLHFMHSCANQEEEEVSRFVQIRKRKRNASKWNISSAPPPAEWQVVVRHLYNTLLTRMVAQRLLYESSLFMYVMVCSCSDPEAHQWQTTLYTGKLNPMTSMARENLNSWSFTRFEAFSSIPRRSIWTRQMAINVHEHFKKAWYSLPVIEFSQRRL